MTLEQDAAAIDADNGGGDDIDDDDDDNPVVRGNVEYSPVHAL